MHQKIDFAALYCGTLAALRRPGGRTFWHLTWKGRKGTITRYVRLQEVPKIRKGIKAYRKAKADLQRIAVSNLAQLMTERKNGR